MRTRGGRPRAGASRREEWTGVLEIADRYVRGAVADARDAKFNIDSARTVAHHSVRPDCWSYCGDVAIGVMGEPRRLIATMQSKTPGPMSSAYSQGPVATAHDGSQNRQYS